MQLLKFIFFSYFGNFIFFDFANEYLWDTEKDLESISFVMFIIRSCLPENGKKIERENAHKRKLFTHRNWFCICVAVRICHQILFVSIITVAFKIIYQLILLFVWFDFVTKQIFWLLFRMPTNIWCLFWHCHFAVTINCMKYFPLEFRNDICLFFIYLFQYPRS